ncbi:hypothetical protein [Endozoicomonas ascidiicola]|uniref:hypothetical protein n=1 Tax=Endozoicomonas ascidiicola TaxID=1698521 RepID=UPI00082F6134|nr:hypothetical protein [Endozoicomonas ascidiicola]
MPVIDFITSVFSLIDDLYKELYPTPIRTSGPPPKLSDSEVITMEIVGEWAGKHNNSDIWNYYGQHWRYLFPDMSSRSKFANQSANLWQVKE